MKTGFLVEYGLYDTTALADGTESTQDNRDFGNLALMKEKTPAPVYMTLEHNFSVLDGSCVEFPDMPEDLAFFSDNMSGTDGTFAENPVLRISFTENHTSIGLTLYFGEVHPLLIEIRWYDLSGIIKAAEQFSVDSDVYFAKKQVEEYGRIEVEFLQTLPYHFIKMYYIEYGTLYIWDENDIKSGKLTEESDSVSNTIRVNKLSFEFVDMENTFNIGNPSGLHRTFQKKQKMLAYEMLDGVKTLLGVFFLDDNSTTKNISKISALDMKGMLDNTDFTDGRIYDGVTAGSVIDEIMEAAGISDYEMDDGTRETVLYGTLKIQTCRKALREVLFACGSTVSTSRVQKMYIHKSDRMIGSKVARDRKFSTTMKMDHYVSDINVKYTTWTLAAESKQITKGNYKAGVHTIKLSNPAADMKTSMGTILKQMPYYLILQLNADAEVEITGRKWEGEELSVLSSIEHIRSGEVRSTKTFTGTLLDYTRAQAVADSILDYYQLQQILDIRYVGGTEEAGRWIEVENPAKQHGNFVAGVETLVTDLTGGFIQTAKCRGYYKLLTDFYFCGTELYADEEVGIL